MVAGLTNGELIAPMTYEETMTSDFFEAWFQKFFLPTLTTPSVIIMDNVRFHRMGKNVRFHRMGKLELLCEEFGHKLLPLPPYSPEYNPIEKTWAHIKKPIGKVKLISINVLAIVSYYFRFSLLYIIMDKGQAVKKLQLF
ncbi:IS630-Spn1%2C transposase Orf2 [Streptococcus pneumoniae]|nr:IS630-Spn1%2C transposase Orf2 [Streptococcus pneumoniae]